MKIAELKKLLKAGEWNDIEFKEARRDVPKSAFETVSAFANSHGGCLVFGVARRDDPPGFRVFREAAVNLLIHQDYGDHSRKGVIKFFRDGFQFWNPGDVFGDDSRLWEPGEKEVRNPSIAMAMRRIAMCEQAGTGLRMMREAWRKLGHPSPMYKNDRSGKAFEFFIPELDKEVDMASDLVKAMFGGSPQVKAQIEAHDGAYDGTYDEAHDHLGDIEQRILSACLDKAQSTPDMLVLLGYGNRTGNLKKALTRLRTIGFLELTIPGKPRSKNQRYRLTAKGRQAMASATAN